MTSTFNTLRSYLYSTATAPPTISNPTLPNGWADTLATRALPSSSSRRDKGKRRGAIPVWGGGGGGAEEELVPDEEDEEGVRGELGEEEKDDDAREKRDREERELTDISERVLYQAGTDSGSPPGPLLVIAPIYLPPATTHNHVKLFEKLRLRLEAFSSQGGYSVVLLPSPTLHPPSTSLLISSYLALPRMTRKNVRRVWVVGGGWWVRVVFTMFSTTLLSGKTAKRSKIVLCPSLSRLAVEMGPEAFVRVEFPPEVYIANSAVESAIHLPMSTNLPPKMFGVQLEILMGDKAELGLPRVVRDCLVVLQAQGPTSVGVFRRSPSSATVKHLQDAYDRGHPVTLAQYPEAAYVAASLLKLFLRSLPTAIFPSHVFPLVRVCPPPNPFPTSSASSPTTFVRTRLLPALPLHSLLILKPIVALLHDIAAASGENLMDVNNLVICLCPGMVGGLGDMRDELEMCRVPGTTRGFVPGVKKSGGSNTIGGVLKILIESHREIFIDDEFNLLDPVVRPPLIDGTSAPSSAPSSPSASSPSSFLAIPEEDNDGAGDFTQPAPVSIPAPPSSNTSASPAFTSSPALATYFSPTPPHSPSRSPTISRTPTLRTIGAAIRSNSQSSLRLTPDGVLVGGSETIGFTGPSTLRAKASRSEVTAGEGVLGKFS